MAQTQFSVVIPCYNDGAYLLEAIASVEAQTEPSWEIVVVDSGSTDLETLEVFKNLASKSKVSVVRATESGPSAARMPASKEPSANLFYLSMQTIKLRPPT